MEVTVLIPALNESPTIGDVIDKVTEQGWKALVGDNGSTDGTHEIALSRGITPIRVPKRGKGNVIRELIKHVDTPLAVMIDADSTYSIKDAQEVLAMLDNCDFVMGYREFREKGSMNLIHFVGNFLLSLQASVLYGCRIRDVNTGLKAFRVEKLKEFELSSNGFAIEADLFINAVKSKCTIGQVPISYKARPDGSSSKLQMWNGIKIGWFLMGKRLKR